MHPIGFLTSGFRFIRFELEKLGLKGAWIFAESLQDNTAGPREKQPANQVSFPQLLAWILKTLITKNESSHRTFQGQLCNRAIQFSSAPTYRWLGVFFHMDAGYQTQLFCKSVLIFNCSTTLPKCFYWSGCHFKIKLLWLLLTVAWLYETLIKWGWVFTPFLKDVFYRTM